MIQRNIYHSLILIECNLKNLKNFKCTFIEYNKIYIMFLFLYKFINNKIIIQ